MVKFMSLTNGTIYYFDPKTGVSKWNSPTPSSTVSPPVAKLPWKVVYSKDGKPYYYNTKSDISQWKIPNDCTSVSGLYNTHNSCYIDSVLQALFAVPSVFSGILLNGNLSSDTRSKICPVKNRQDIQEELRNISSTLAGTNTHPVNNVDRLRSLLEKCPANIERFYDHNQHDSGEFLSYLLDFFPIASTALTKVVTWGTNSTEDVPSMESRSVQSEVVDKVASVIITVDPFTLLENRDVNIPISSYITEHNDSILDSPYKVDGVEYIRRVSTKTMISSPIIIINLNRRNPIDTKRVIRTTVIPTETLNLVGGQKFTFSAVVLFHNRHYVCYYKCGDIWYLYNDLSPSLISQVGSYQKLLESTNITTDGVTFYYNIV